MKLMNKLIIAFLALFVTGNSLSWAANPLSKPMQKAYKAECKQLKKEGWKLYDNSKSVEDALLDYYKLLDKGGQDVSHIVGFGQSKSANMAMRKAMTNAKAQWTSTQESEVSGSTTIRMSNEQSGTVTSKQESESAIRSSSEQVVKGFNPTVSLTRTLPDGNVEVRLYYIVNAK